MFGWSVRAPQVRDRGRYFFRGKRICAYWGYYWIYGSGEYRRKGAQVPTTTEKKLNQEGLACEKVFHRGYDQIHIYGS